MHAAGTSQREIARMVGRFKAVVNAYLHNPEGYNTMRRSSRRASLTPATVHRIVRTAQTGQYSSLQLVRTLNLNLTVSIRPVRSALAREDTLRYAKHKSSPVLTKAHKLARFEWACASVTLGANWESTIFADEKKLNLDGHDGLQHC